jgi:hypothetical protein
MFWILRAGPACAAIFHGFQYSNFNGCCEEEEEPVWSRSFYSRPPSWADLRPTAQPFSALPLPAKHVSTLPSTYVSTKNRNTWSRPHIEFCSLYSVEYANLGFGRGGARPTWWGRGGRMWVKGRVRDPLWTRAAFRDRFPRSSAAPATHSPGNHLLNSNPHRRGWQWAMAWQWHVCYCTPAAIAVSCSIGTRVG